MQQPEPLQGWRGAVAAIVLMTMALLGTGVNAMGSSMTEARADPASTMSDGMACALCYIAPAPCPNASTDEVTEPALLTWWVHAGVTPVTVKFPATADCLDKVPIRTALCRWLN